MRKGLINDPHLVGSRDDIEAGLQQARRLLRDILRTRAAGCEFLEPTSPQNIADTVAGARSARARPRARCTASWRPGCRCRSGSRTPPTATCRWRSTACRRRPPGTFLRHRRGRRPAPWSRPPATRTGTSSCAAAAADRIRRGRRSRAAVAALSKAGLGAGWIVDCSHANWGKDHVRQAEVARETAARIAAGETGVCGIMLEFVPGGRRAAARARPAGLRPVRDRQVHGLRHHGFGAARSRRGARADRGGAATCAFHQVAARIAGTHPSDSVRIGLRWDKLVRLLRAATPNK